MHKRIISGLLRDLAQRVQNLLNHPAPSYPVQYMNALINTQTCLQNTLKQLNQIYTNQILLPEAHFWTHEKQAQHQATAAITLWILVGGYTHPSLMSA